jgi:hypothetical protein
LLPGTVRVLTTGPAASRPHSWPRLSPPVTEASDGLPGATGGRYEKCPIVAAPVALHTQRRSRVPPPLTTARRQPSPASARTRKPQFSLVRASGPRWCDHRAAVAAAGHGRVGLPDAPDQGRVLGRLRLASGPHRHRGLTLRASAAVLEASSGRAMSQLASSAHSRLRRGLHRGDRVRARPSPLRRYQPSSARRVTGRRRRSPHHVPRDLHRRNRSPANARARRTRSNRGWRGCRHRAPSRGHRDSPGEHP